ncbi:MAG: dihydropteroate synthase [candidate division WOR-3 bacterium]|nr:dihydropteroate synthase [candidate division WOR-3 bacterium]
MRKLIIDNEKTVTNELKRMHVDPDAYKIFIKKAEYMALKFDGLSCAQVNVLKQTALICDADAAIPKSAYKGGRGKKYPLILFANRREIEKIERRLREQPWMEDIRIQLASVMIDKQEPLLKIGRKRFVMNRTYIMGVINLTPDSFYSGSRYTDRSIIEKVVNEMNEEGVDFIDIGAESTRPKSAPVDEKEEIRRLKRVLPLVAKLTRVPISVDTYKARVAALAIDQGASIINDVSGHRFDQYMVKTIARSGVSTIIMHMKGKPRTMQRNPQYKDLMREIYNFLQERIDHAVESGIDRDRIVIDPGLGFGKLLADNYVIIRRLAELRQLGRPVLVGHSRKSFVGNPFGLSPENRLEGTLGIQSLLIQNGASILRVHDVMEAKRVASIIDLITR